MSPVTDPREGGGGGGKVRACRARGCIEVKRELKVTVAALQQKLTRLETDYRLNGPGNARDAEYRRLQNCIDGQMREHQRMDARRRTIERQLRDAEAERLGLAREKATLLSDISLLRGRVAELERAQQRREEADAVKQRYDARAVSRERALLRAEQERVVRGAETETAAAQAAASAAAASAEVAVAEAEASAARQVAEAEESIRSDAERRVAEADARAAAAETRAAAAEEWARDAEADADEARATLIDEEARAREAEAGMSAAEWEVWDAERRAARAKETAEKLQRRVDGIAPPTSDRTDEGWEALSVEARRKAAERERFHLLSFFSSHAWRVSDIADALQMLWWTRALFDTRPFFDIYFEKVGGLMTQLEQVEYGVTFGLYLHYEARMTFPKILKLTQAGAKVYDHHSYRYKPKLLLGHRYLKGVGINVPRVAPPISKLEPKVREIEKVLNIEHSEDGTMAFVPFASIVQQVLSRDAGRGDMPPLPFFLGGHQKLPIVLCWDATGYGTKQFNTFAVRNPYMSAAAQQLHVLGLGNCDDGREGTARLLGSNLAAINEAIIKQQGLNEGERCINVEVDGTPASIALDVKITTDLSCLRHCEHIAASGFCGCNRDFALRHVPKKPENQAQLRELLRECHEHTFPERVTLSHSRHKDGSIRPCPCCSFGHDAARPHIRSSPICLPKRRRRRRSRRRRARRRSPAGGWSTRRATGTCSRAPMATRS